MTKTASSKTTAGKQTAKTPRTPSTSKKKEQKPRKKGGKQAAGKQSGGNKRRVLYLGLEVSGLAAVAVALIMVVFGYSATWFSGTRFFESLLPFAVSVAGLILVTAVVLIGWWSLRKWLLQRSPLLPAALSVGLACAMGYGATLGQFTQGYESFRALVGGRKEDRRITLAHQVYAAYRRSDQMQMHRMIERAQPYAPALIDAAKAFDIDLHLLQGVAAVESSFMPRDSKDNGTGLFQITQAPESALKQAGRRLSVDTITLTDPRHNAFVAAATLKYYLAEMKGNLFLGLLAYNIGPANGGLRFIMKQYGATDFVTIQPYLQQLPRDYPIRVLSYSLAFRLWDREGQLLAYEEGNNALRIQHIGIPGLKNDE